MASAGWRVQSETRSHLWRDLKVRKRYIILNYGCLHSLCQQPWATKTTVLYSSFSLYLYIYRVLKHFVTEHKMLSNLKTANQRLQVTNERPRCRMYSRVSGAEGRLPDGDVVVVVVGWPDPVQGAGAGAQARGEAALQQHVRPLHHVLHPVLLRALADTTWNRIQNINLCLVNYIFYFHSRSAEFLMPASEMMIIWYLTIWYLNHICTSPI